MTIKLHRNEFVVAVVLFVVCLSAGIYGYFIKPPKLPDNPTNIVLSNNGGTVLFTHKQHFDEDGGAFECETCHHNYDPEEQPPSEMNCRVCHYNEPDVVETVCNDDATHPRCIGKQCNECHDGEECTFCHRTAP